MSIYFEDIDVGEIYHLGAHTFSREEIIAFAREFDPQSFHLDDEAAAASLFGSLAASGWHTASIWLRHVIDFRKRQADQMRFRGERPALWGPSPGFEAVKWLKPVLVGDTITFTARFAEKRDSRSRPTVGLVYSANEGINQNGELVFAVTSKMFVERRHPGAAEHDPA